MHLGTHPARDLHILAEGKNLKQLVENNSAYGDVFVSCFCEQPNLLSQWAGYGQAEGDTGVSIEFDFPEDGLEFKYESSNPKSTFNGQTVTLSPFKVCYDEAERNAFVEKVASELVLRPDIFEECGELSYISALLEICVPYIKNAGFSQEQESRLVFFPPAGAKIGYRIRRNMIVPSVKLEVSYSDKRRLPIKRIIIGPSTTQIQIMSALLDILEPNNDNEKCTGLSILREYESKKSSISKTKKRSDQVSPFVLFCDSERGLISAKTSNGIIVSLSDLPLRTK